MHELLLGCGLLLPLRQSAAGSFDQVQSWDQQDHSELSRHHQVEHKGNRKRRARVQLEHASGLDADFERDDSGGGHELVRIRRR